MAREQSMSEIRSCDHGDEFGPEWSPKVFATVATVDGKVLHRVACPVCGRGMDAEWHETEEDAVAAWNRRHPADS